MAVWSNAGSTKRSKTSGSSSCSLSSSENESSLSPSPLLSAICAKDSSVVIITGLLSRNEVASDCQKSTDERGWSVSEGGGVASQSVGFTEVVGFVFPVFLGGWGKDFYRDASID
jgi:hypothetical protein